VTKCCESEGAGTQDERERQRIDNFRQALARQMGLTDSDDRDFDGYALRDVLMEKWGRSYDIQIKVMDWIDGRRILTVNIMWRYLEQQSFYADEATYLSHMQAVAEYLVRWNAVATFKQYVREYRRRPRVGMAVGVPIDLDDTNIDSFLNDLKAQ